MSDTTPVRDAKTDPLMPQNAVFALIDCQPVAFPTAMPMDDDRGETT
jgi:hypothetical protein